MPVVSVILPVYNGESYLREAVDSILNQTFRDFKFVIKVGRRQWTDFFKRVALMCPDFLKGRWA